mmetsp:Transcript_10912/g.28709  ORF Transcript_10912/g.28709 Transcript_10912/m.28709 type:complete len:200 (-) Transcript_10912:25-624(-)
MPMGPPPPPIGPPPPPPFWLRRCRKMRPPMISSGNASDDSTPRTAPPAEGSAGDCTANTTFFFVRVLISSPDSPGRRSDSWRLPSLSIDTTCLPSAAKLTFSTWSASTASRKVLSDHGELRGSAAETDWPSAAAKPAAAAPRCARRTTPIWGAAVRGMTGRDGAPVTSASTPSEPTASAAVAERRTMMQKLVRAASSAR